MMKMKQLGAKHSLHSRRSQDSRAHNLNQEEKRRLGSDWDRTMDQEQKQELEQEQEQELEQEHHQEWRWRRKQHP